MRARIHRGANEIGGNCVELAAGGKRLVLDLGRPLLAEPNEDVPLPQITGLADSDDLSLLGVVISHPHPDHYGLATGLDPRIPLYIGEAASAILREAAFFGAATPLPKPAGFLADGKTLELGPFRITPYLVDHSGFDSYALLAEANGRRLFYSGDLRAHGRKRETFERLVRDPPAPIHTLLMEGTRLSRPEVGGEPDDELVVERQIESIARETQGLVLAIYSPQNVDRMVTVYKAARRARRVLVLDLYAASVAAATGRTSISQADWRGIRVYVPNSQLAKVIATKQFRRIDEIKAARIYMPDVLASAEEYVLTFRASMLGDLGESGLKHAQAIWSMWPGYLDSEDMDGDLIRPFARHHVPITVAHCSGHASVRDLKRFAAAFAAGRIVPIHTDVPEQFETVFERVDRRADGEWWDV